MDAIYGVTLEMLAELMSKDSELRTQFNEQQGRAEFERYLAGRGLDQNTYALAHNSWQDRFRADPTGRTEAQFHMMLQQHSLKTHFADVRDMSQDVQGGVTLDTYVQINLAMGKPGANADAIVAQHGLDMPAWQAATAAWTAAMTQDTSHRLTTQYGMLYQKHAGPEFQEQMLAKTAAALAAGNARRDVVDEPQEELTPALCLQKMQSPSRNERWRYARLYANMADLGNVPDKAQAIAAVTPHLIEMVENHDEDTVSDAEAGIARLWDLGVRNDDIKGSVARCLNRAREKLASLQAAFAPIQNQAVPERVALQSRIQDFTSLVETMEDYVSREWNAPQGPQGLHGPQGPQAASFASAFPVAPPSPPSMGGGFPKWIIAPIVLVVVGSVVATKVLGKSKNAAKTATSSASASAAPSSATSAAAAAATTATAAVTGGAPSKPAPTTTTKTPAGKKKK